MDLKEYLFGSGSIIEIIASSKPIIVTIILIIIWTVLFTIIFYRMPEEMKKSSDKPYIPIMVALVVGDIILFSILTVLMLFGVL